jgi:hypothetical protein
MNNNYEFKQFDGYFLLSRIFTSITLKNPIFEIDKYFKIILNNCFKEPVVSLCLNNQKTNFIFNNKTTTNIFLINPNGSLFCL